MEVEQGKKDVGACGAPNLSSFVYIHIHIQLQNFCNPLLRRILVTYLSVAVCVPWPLAYFQSSCNDI